MTQQPGGWPAQNANAGWGGQQSQSAPQDVPPPNSTDNFFDGVGERGAPSFKWNGQIGDQIAGTIVSQYATVVKDTGGIVKFYPPKPGQPQEPIPQLNVTLQTDLRNWDRVAPDSIPKDDQGNPKPPSEDDGTRRIYVKFDMRTAIAKALRAAGVQHGGIQDGGKLAVRLSGFKPTSQPNPLPLYEARYQPAPPPSASDSFFPQEQPAQAPQQQAAPVYQQPAQAPQQQAAPAYQQGPPPGDPWSTQQQNDDPPF